MPPRSTSGPSSDSDRSCTPLTGEGPPAIGMLRQTFSLVSARPDWWRALRGHAHEEKQMPGKCQLYGSNNGRKEQRRRRRRRGRTWRASASVTRSHARPACPHRPTQTTSQNDFTCSAKKKNQIRSSGPPAIGSRAGTSFIFFTPLCSAWSKPRGWES